MTDTASPITEPHLTPMFATGAQPAVSPNTEPHPSPIFDTGPHPEPLQPSSSQSAEESTPRHDPSAAIIVQWDSGEWESAAADSGEVAVETAGSEPASPVDPETSDPEVLGPEALDYERAPMWDAGSPESEPELARIARDLDAAGEVAVDMDPSADPAMVGDSDPAPGDPAPQAFSESDNVDTDAFLRSVTGHLRPVVMTAQPIVVPSAYQFLKRWKLALIVAGVWVVAAAGGAGFYFWWYTALDKTLPVFGILLYLTACMVASVLVSMVPDRPQLTSLAIALMSAPLASTAAAAVLHGAYFFEWISRPMVG